MSELERACATVATKDATPLRRALFAQFLAQRPWIRGLATRWDALPTPVRTVLLLGLAARCAREVRGPRSGGALLGIAKYRNEQRQLDHLAGLVPSVSFARITLDGEFPALRTGVGARRLLRRYAAHDFLVASRVASTIGYSLRLRRILADHPARAVIVSSDTNPYAVALLAAARELGRKTVFVTHGHVAEGPPPLTVDLALFDGEATRAVYERAGPIDGEVVLRGCEGASRPMRVAERCRTLGVFLSILIEPSGVARALDRLRAALQPERILLRLHPNLVLRDPQALRQLDLDGIEVSEGDRVLTDDAWACDRVAIGNSSAHLSVLKAGVPTLYVPGLDRLDDDFYRFVADGLVCDALDDDAIRTFYEHPDWPRRFARYDAAHPDAQPSCDAAVAEALRRIVR